MRVRGSKLNEYDNKTFPIEHNL